MEWFKQISIPNRACRHLLFWLAWIIGFTFIKSFGAALEVYLAWFVYYIVTLPIFITHTYIVVYWLAGKFMKGAKILVFVALFTGFLYLFSYLELLISHKLLALWFPLIFETSENFLAPGNILISGIGNLYIVLVFIAVKMIRSWYLASEEKKNIDQRLLEDIAAEANLKIQPDLLIYATGQMEILAERKSEKVSASIAILSEILNGTMLTRGRSAHRIDEELALIRKLLKLHSIFNDREAPGIYVNGEDLFKANVPVLVIFTMVEFLLRQISRARQITINLPKIKQPFFAGINIELDEKPGVLPDAMILHEGISHLLSDRYLVKGSYENNSYDVQMSFTDSRTRFTD